MVGRAAEALSVTGVELPVDVVDHSRSARPGLPNSKRSADLDRKIGDFMFT